MSIEWQDRSRAGEVVMSMATVGGMLVKVHRSKDEDPGQWAWSCYALEIQHCPVGRVGDDIAIAKRIALAELKSVIAPVWRALAKVRP